MEDVPPPTIEPGTVLVKVHSSCISTGTELSALRVSDEPLWKKAVTDPSKIRKGLRVLATEGIAGGRRALQRQETPQPLGYSAAGKVIEIGGGIADIRTGDRVACGGTGVANHAEIVLVPRNLVAPVPEGVSLTEASFVTPASIALQGVRRASPTLGETFVVLGLGLIGQLTVQVLKAHGCRVIALDLDTSRVDLACRLGADAGLPGSGDAVEARVAQLTGGVGADGVIITAASTSDSVVASAFHFCRKKGRVVLVGDVGLRLNRQDMYEKELDFLISTSYGPGRYDRRYEEEGVDYPIGYVRWTENRNMTEVLALMVEKKLSVQELVGSENPVDRAADAYGSLREGGQLAALLHYPEAGAAMKARTIPNPQARPSSRDRIRIALIGAGAFASATHLPNLHRLSHQFELRAVVSRTGTSAAEAARRFQALYSATNTQQVLDDDDVDALIITTRHDQHASLALAALQAGKHVFVEKPLALSSEEADAIEAFYVGKESVGESGPLLQVGFNRRFSPHVTVFEEFVRRRTNPMIVTYRMNAGYISLDHWIHGPQGGGRNIGEACHVYDIFTYLTDSPVKDVSAHTLRPKTAYYSSHDNFVATLSFEDGSLASLAYTALGSRDYPKEHMEVFCDASVLVMKDYVHSRAIGAEVIPDTSNQGKGHLEELAAFATAIRRGDPWPIPLWQQLQTTRISFEVEKCLGAL